jgi:sec-independent protein translocase protein TatB
MIDFAWSEFLFIALLALILIGPKELPAVLRYIGRMIGKARAFTKELSSQLDLESHLESTDLDTKNTNIPQNKEPSPFEDTKL